MKRTLLVCLIAGAFLAVVLAGAIAETTKSGEVPDAFLIEHKDMKPKDLKPGVAFTHLKHSVDYKLSCTECHHKYEGGQNVWKEGDKVHKCDECHDMVKEEGKQYKLKNAFHHNCQDCHKELEKAGKAAGPTKKCNDCHTGKLP